VIKMKIWSIVQYNGNNYIILKYNKKGIVTITKYSGEITKDGVLSQVDNYYEDVIDLVVRDDIPISIIKTNKIEKVLYEWG